MPVLHHTEHDEADDLSHCSAEQATRLLREVLYRGPIYRKLYTLRRHRPDLAYELDDLAIELRRMGDRIEALVRCWTESAELSSLASPDRDRPNRAAE